MADDLPKNAWVARNFERRPGDSECGLSAEAVSHSGCVVPARDVPSSQPALGAGNSPAATPAKVNGSGDFSECSSAFPETSIAELQAGENHHAGDSP